MAIIRCAHSVGHQTAPNRSLWSWNSPCHLVSTGLGRASINKYKISIEILTDILRHYAIFKGLSYLLVVLPCLLLRVDRDLLVDPGKRFLVALFFIPNIFHRFEVIHICHHIFTLPECYEQQIKRPLYMTIDI